MYLGTEFAQDHGIHASSVTLVRVYMDDMGHSLATTWKPSKPISGWVAPQS